MTGRLLSHTRRGCTHTDYPLVTLGACVLALTSCGVPLPAPVRRVQARMCWSGVVGQPPSSRHRWRLASRCTWLRTPPLRCAAAWSSAHALTARSRRITRCTASRGTRAARAACRRACRACARVANPLSGSGPLLPCVLAGSAPAAVRGGRPRAARRACRTTCTYLFSPGSARHRRSAGAGPILPFRRLGDLPCGGCGRGRMCGHVVALSVCARRRARAPWRVGRAGGVTACRLPCVRPAAVQRATVSARVRGVREII